MRTTLIINDELLKEASRITSIKEKTALVHAGLRALLEQAARQQLARAGGSEPRLKAPRRRRER